jgi:hypothetical protein
VRFLNHSHHPGSGDAWRAARPGARSSPSPPSPKRETASAKAWDLLRSDSQLGGHFPILLSCGRQQHGAGAPDQTSQQRSRPQGLLRQLLAVQESVQAGAHASEEPLYRRDVLHSTIITTYHPPPIERPYWVVSGHNGARAQPQAPSDLNIRRRDQCASPQHESQKRDRISVVL